LDGDASLEQNVFAGTGKSYDPPTPKHFSFNAPAGACPVCHGPWPEDDFRRGAGRADMELPLDGAIQPWRRAGKRLIIYYKAMLRSVAAHFGVSTENALQGSAGGFQKVLLTAPARTRLNSNSGARQGEQHQPPV